MQISSEEHNNDETSIVCQQKDDDIRTKTLWSNNSKNIGRLSEKKRLKAIKRTKNMWGLLQC